MGNLKKIISLLLILSLVFSTGFSVFADELIENNIEPNSDISDSEDEEIDYENDPMYLKYLTQPMTMSIYGAGNLVHNSRFGTAKKAYGIDVSYFNSNINWKKVKNSGIDYVIIRVGYRGYGDGQLVVDNKFRENLNNAKAAGVSVGLYFFTQAINTNEAKQEAKFVLNQIKGVKLELPIYYDIEEVYYGSSRLDNAHLSYNTKTSLCKSFCDTIQKAGYRAGVYASYNWLTNLINGKELGKKYDIWVAQYGRSCTYKNNYDMWQYTGQGYVDGVSTVVDMNVMYLINKPNKVTDLKGTQSGNKVNLKWSSSFGAYGYTVYAKDTQTGTIKEVCKTTSTSKTVVIPYSTTKFYVKAYYKIGSNYMYSPYSNGVAFNLDKVSNIKIDPMRYATTWFDLTWSKVYNASGYEIRMYDSATKKYKVLGHTNSTKYCVNKLKPATEYKFKIAAYFNDGTTSVFDSDKSKYGTWSNEVVLGTKTEQTKNLQIVSNKANSIKIKWSKINGRCDGYQIVVYDFNKKKQYVAGYTNKNTNQFEIKKLKSGSIYDIKVRAYYLVNSTKTPGVYSGIKSCITVCDSPKNIKYSNLKSNQLTLNWSKTNGANGYKIYEKANNKVKLVGTTKTNSFTIKNLKKYTSHRYYVKAYKTFNRKEYLSGYSSGITVNLAVAPKKLSVSKYSDTSVTVKWNKTSGANKYVVYVYNTSKKKYVAYKTVKSPSCTINKLKNNKAVKVSVKAVYGSNYSNFSPVKTVYTRCKAPTNFKVSAKGSTYQKLTWKKSSGATQYWIYKYNTKTHKYYKLKVVGNTSSSYIYGLSRNAKHTYKIYAVKKTSLKTYVSKGSKAVSAWTTR